MSLLACTSLGIALAMGVAGPARAGPAPGRTLVVFCSPGSPGTTAEAQPTMDAFAAAVARKASLPGALAAVYDEAEDAGVARLRSPEAAVAVVSLPFYLKHERELSLRARLQPVSTGRPALDRWALVVKKGRVASAAALDGYTIASSAGFAPAFVRGPAVGGWGPIPGGARVVQSGAVLSALRRAAAGEKLAVLLDGVQEAALGALPFAADLEVVARSAPLPAGVVATVGARMAPKAWSALASALEALPSDAAGAAALEAVQMTRFAPLDERALADARKAYADAAR